MQGEKDEHVKHSNVLRLESRGAHCVILLTSLNVWKRSQAGGKILHVHSCTFQVILAIEGFSKEKLISFLN